MLLQADRYGEKKVPLVSGAPAPRPKSVKLITTTFGEITLLRPVAAVGSGAGFPPIRVILFH
jgi:hypothetical protein